MATLASPLTNLRLEMTKEFQINIDKKHLAVVDIDTFKKIVYFWLHTLNLYNGHGHILNSIKIKNININNIIECSHKYYLL